MTNTSTKTHAAITAVGGFVPNYVLTNQELETMVDTNDEWILSRTGIKERRMLKDEGAGSSFMASEAVKDLMKQRGITADEIDMIICATITPDMVFPATANVVADIIGAKNAWGFDLSAACSGFLYGMELATSFIESGKHKKVIVIGVDTMSSIIDYTDRNTCIIFGDGAGAVLLEPNTEGYGVQDSIMKADGVGRHYLHQVAGGSVKPASHETVDAREHYVRQDGKTVFKYATANMADITEEVMKNNDLDAEKLDYLLAHQANLRIIDYTAKRIGLPKEKALLNIQRYGNTTAGTIPLLLWDYQKKFKKGDKIILTTFGGGFTWGAMYLTWA